ncbi:uncharacterized protein V1518DRAFT_426911 [Limtongia smithiae]|uniref:uncharacterized protein n=1 Tax=Limtongia smithiae TaxID=1125753 RepID=UPI0034CED81E
MVASLRQRNILSLCAGVLFLVSVYLLVRKSSATVQTTSAGVRASSTKHQKFTIGYCDEARAISSKAIVVPASSKHEDLTMMRIRFDEFDPKLYSNPNILPAPRGSSFDYVGFARYDPKEEESSETKLEIHWCLMTMRTAPITGLNFIECSSQPTPLPSPHFESVKDSCGDLKHLELDFGLIDHRVFWSPFGEPLMLVVSNSHVACLGQYLIDLRVLVPELSHLLRVENVPIRYGKYVELDDVNISDTIFHRNWMMLFDEHNYGYISYGMLPQAVAAISKPEVNIAQGSPNCLQEIVQATTGTVATLIQASNSLRLTLCRFPCTPTLENTVLISLVQAEYSNNLDIYYRRYLVMMEPVAPFKIIARSRNLIYAGADNTNPLFSASLIWDTNERNHASWANYEPEIKDEKLWKAKKLHKRGGTDLKKKTAPQEVMTPAGEQVHADWIHIRDVDHMMYNMQTQFQNHLVSDYYQGWLDDTLVITFSISSLYSGFIQVNARDMVNCLIECSV